MDMDNGLLYKITDPRQGRDRGEFLSFADVQQRLVEAMRTAQRLPDREAGWLHSRAFWPETRPEPGDHDARGGDMVAPPIRPLPLTRKDIAEMEEAFGWLDAVRERDRRVISLALGWLARGHPQVPWKRLLRPMGLRHGADGLRKRYSRAMRRVVIRANR